MNEHLLKRIKNQLNARFYVMNDTWLRDCIDFFINGKSPSEMTDKLILEFVEGQWQLSNLREINNENGCLPKNLLQQVHIVLTGTYILQVEKMYDITNSKYKQLCEVRKINCENLEVTEKEKSLEPVPKARRMLQLYLTDGVQDITAIEYVPLKQFTNMLLPGYKVMIIGPVDCRRGIILLRDDNYREVGGEVEPLLKPNALENVLARALGEPENPDPYNDNGSSKNEDVQTRPTRSSSKSDFFDDDFEQAVDFTAVTAIEQRGQETLENVILNTQTFRRETENNIEEFLEKINFDPLDNRSNPSIKPLRVLPILDAGEFEEEDSIINVEKVSNSVDKIKHKSFLERPFNVEDAAFLDDDFDFDCDIIDKTEELKRQQKCHGQSGTLNKNISKYKNEVGIFSSPGMLKQKLINDYIPEKVEKCNSMEVLTERNKRSAFVASSITSTSKTDQRLPKIPKIKTVANFASTSSKNYDILSDVLSQTITQITHKTVKAQVKTHSALMKQGKCWELTAVIADHSSSVEVCFDSEILEKFLGFSVEEFSRKKKLGKSNPQVREELRIRLRKAQHQIQNLDALLKLELTQSQIPKVIDITQFSS